MAQTVTPHFQQHCSETLLLVLNLKLAHEMQKTHQLQDMLQTSTYSIVT